VVIAQGNLNTCQIPEDPCRRVSPDRKDFYEGSDNERPQEYFPVSDGLSVLCAVRPIYIQGKTYGRFLMQNQV
jgi:hypothetical protein